MQSYDYFASEHVIVSSSWITLIQAVCTYEQNSHIWSFILVHPAWTTFILSIYTCEHIKVIDNNVSITSTNRVALILPSTEYSQPNVLAKFWGD